MNSIITELCEGMHRWIYPNANEWNVETERSRPHLHYAALFSSENKNNCPFLTDRSCSTTRCSPSNIISSSSLLSHGERYCGRNSVGNGTKRLQNGSIHAVFPLFYRRNPSSLITGRFFQQNDCRWLAEKRHVIRDNGLRRVIRDNGLRRVIITVFTVSWSVSIVCDPVFLDLGSFYCLSNLMAQ